MKSKIFKIVLPAFTLMFAVVASLAFTSSSTDAPETYFYEDTAGVCQTVVIEEVNCAEIISEIPCTVSILGTPTQLYVDKLVITGECIKPLWKLAQ